MNAIQWKYVKPLESINLIADFEKAYSFVFDNLYKDFVRQHNGGRPSLSVFGTDELKQRSIKSLLSFNKTDKENIWAMNEWIKDEIGNECIAFAIDSFGNLICFERKNRSIVFWNHEDGSIGTIANSFEGFINNLQEPNE